jgi:hypothetical protein
MYSASAWAAWKCRPNRSPLVAFLVQPDRGFVAVLVKIRDLQSADGGQPGAGVQKES